MTQLILLGQTLTTAPVPFSQILLRETQADVLLTNILYSDDAEMNALLARKRAVYPAGTQFHTSMHELARPVLNWHTGRKVLFIDTLNFYVSNILLLFNSDPSSVPEMRAYMEADVTQLLQGLSESGLEQLIVYTGEVDFDYYIRTEAGVMYRDLIYAITSVFARQADRYGLLTNGAILWIK